MELGRWSRVEGEDGNYKRKMTRLYLCVEEKREESHVSRTPIGC